MTAQQTDWMYLGQPVSGGRVEATKITVRRSQDGTTRDVTAGTLPMGLADLWTDHEHLHDDGGLMLSGLDGGERERIDDAFTPEDN